MLTRREFFKLALASAAGLSLTEALTPHLAEAYAGKQGMPIIWLETNTCGGDILSFLNALTPTLRELLYSDQGLLFSNTISAAEGSMAMKYLFDAAEENKNNFILVVEGTIATRANGHYSVIGHWENGDPITALEALKTLAPKAKYVVAAGTCASFGGPYAAKPNPSASKPISKIIGEPLINVSGCPIHPDWMTGTLTHLLLYGFPRLDVHRRPTIFYGKLIHDFCPRRQFFDNGKFAKKPGDPECLYKIGCKGPSTFSDCPTREWASFHYNWPVKAGSPCIGCTSPEFPDGDSPFFERLPGVKFAGGTTVSANRIGILTGAVTAAGLGAHLVGNIATGRLKKTITEGRKDIEKEKDIRENNKMKNNNNNNQVLPKAGAESKQKEDGPQNNTVNLKLTKEEATKLLGVLIGEQDKKDKSWPDKVEFKLKSAFQHDGIIPDRKKGIRGFVSWAKKIISFRKGGRNG